MNWIKKIFIVIGIVVTTYILAVGFFVLSPDISDFIDQSDFDSTTWIAWEENESTLRVRWNMINDLIKNYDLKGKSSQEIEKLLGEPTREDIREVSYYLGITGHGINTGTLTFFLENGIVVGYDIWQG